MFVLKNAHGVYKLDWAKTAVVYNEGWVEGMSKLMPCWSHSIKTELYIALSHESRTFLGRILGGKKPIEKLDKLDLETKVRAIGKLSDLAS